MYQTLEYAARLEGVPDKVTERVKELLQTLDLTEASKRMSAAISGGQRKRLSVAMGMVADPCVLLLDEPTSGLDTVACEQLLDCLAEQYNPATGRCCVAVIHQPSKELVQKFHHVIGLKATKGSLTRQRCYH